MIKPNLQQVCVLNTRPLFGDGQLKLNQQIRQLGGTVFSLPLQRIEAIEVESWINQLPSLNQVQQAIFVSRPASFFFFKALQQHKIKWPNTIQTIAIGSATAQALQQQGISTHYLATHANSEQLMQLPCFAHCDNQTILCIKGPHGRTFIRDELIKKNVHAIEINVYQSLVIDYSEQQLKFLWEDDKVNVVLITSEQALNHLWSILPLKGKEWLREKNCLVFSSRIADIAKRLSLQKISITEHHQIIDSLLNLS
jgi:uroporphyrinogen-III synthase